MQKNHVKLNDQKVSSVRSKLLSKEISKIMPIASLIGRDSNSVIQLKEETNKESGDAVIFNLRGYLRHNGENDSDRIKDNEEYLYFISDRVAIDELSHAVRVQSDGTVNQYTIRDLRSEVENALVDRHADRLTTMFFFHVCGYTANYIDIGHEKIMLKPVHYGFNRPTPPTDKRIIRPNGKTADGDLDKNDIFDLELIDKAVDRAKLENPKIKPVRVGRENLYVLYMYPTQVVQLRNSTEKERWIEITKAQYHGNRVKHPLLDGAIGIYNGVILHETECVTAGIQLGEDDGGTPVQNVRRAVLLGAQSAIMAVGKNRGEADYQLVERVFDHDREFEAVAKIIIGMKKTRFSIFPKYVQDVMSMSETSKQDFGTIVLPTWAETI
ncbi:phage capsid family protein [Bartonella sp. CB178]|uniref:phage capsid family protein n=1 Tax=Bartonella sp. CB178 TaxID=3112255 RepID=UPI00300DDC4B